MIQRANRYQRMATVGYLLPKIYPPASKAFKSNQSSGNQTGSLVYKTKLKPLLARRCKIPQSAHHNITQRGQQQMQTTES